MGLWLGRRRLPPGNRLNKWNFRVGQAFKHLSLSLFNYIRSIL